MKHSDQGITRDDHAEEQPADKQRAQQSSQSNSATPPSQEGKRDPGLSDRPRRSGQSSSG